MGFSGNENYLLLRDISYQIELGYCNFRSLSTRHKINLFSKIDPVVTQWEKIGLIRINDGCLHLTRAGEFWVINLAQTLIDVLQMQEKKDR